MASEPLLLRYVRAPLRSTARLALAAVISACFLVCPAKADEPPSDEVKSAARALARDGDALWDRADYAGALDRFTRAYALVRAPTLAARQAECLVRLGRWVEASERYLAISRTRLEPDAPEAFRQAVQQASAERESLLAKLPKLTLRIGYPVPAQARVTVDERELPRALWGVAWPLDPGPHRIMAACDASTVVRSVVAQEGQSQSVDIQLPCRASSVPPPSRPAGAPVAGKTPPLAAPGQKNTGSSQRTWGWIAAGVGGAGLAAAGLSFWVASGKRQSLDDAGCESAHCPTSLQSEVDSYNGWRMGSMLSLAAGVLGVGTGAALLLGAPRTAAPRNTTAWVGPASAGLAGSF